MSSVISRAQGTYKVARVRSINAAVPTAGWLSFLPARTWNLPCPGYLSNSLRQFLLSCSGKPHSHMRLLTHRFSCSSHRIGRIWPRLPATALYRHEPRHWPRTRVPPRHGSNDLRVSAWSTLPSKLPAPSRASSTLPPMASPPALILAPPSRLPASRGDPQAWTWNLPHPAMLELALAALSFPTWAALTLTQGNNSQASLLFLHFTNCPGTSFCLAIHLTG